MAGFAAHGGKVSAGEASGRVRHLWMRNRPRGEPQMSSGLKIDIDWFGEPILPVNHRLKKIELSIFTRRVPSTWTGGAANY